MIKITFVNIAIFILTFSYGQNSESINGLISNPEDRTIYRNHKNLLEFFVCSFCDSTFIIAKGGTIELVNDYSFYILPNPSVRSIRISVSCLVNEDTSELWAENYNVRMLPNPSLYLGGINLHSDLNYIQDNIVLTSKFFTARYDENIPISNAEFTIEEWSITIDKKEIRGNDRNLSEAYFKAIYYARKNKKIQFNYCILKGPSGFKRKVYSNQVYYKKTKRKTYLDNKGMKKYLTPESGG